MRPAFDLLSMRRLSAGARRAKVELAAPKRFSVRRGTAYNHHKRQLGDPVNDLRTAVRALQATPVVTLVVVMSLALGIGANTAIFSIVNSLLLRALPVERPDRLVLLLSNPSVNPGSPWTNPQWEQMRDHHADLFQTTFAFSRRTTRVNLAQGGPTDFVDGIFASGRYFEALGVTPM